MSYDSWKTTEPGSDGANHGLGCPCSDCEREQETRDVEMDAREAESHARPTMYAHLPDVEYKLDRTYHVLVEGKRVENQPGKPLIYQSTEMLTCQHCGRRAVAHSLRVVCEPDDRCKGGKRYFHALVEGQRQSLCTDCNERDRAVRS